MPYEFSDDPDKVDERPSAPAPRRPLRIRILHFFARIAGGMGAKRLSAFLYRRLIAKGDTEAMYVLGKMYWWGYRFTRDPAKAVELIEYAAIRGNQQAIDFKQEMIDSGLWRHGKNRDEFMSVFDELAEKEDQLRQSSHFFQIIIYTVILVVFAWVLSLTK